MSRLSLCAAVTTVAALCCGVSVAEGRGGPPPANLPAGECEGEWKEPEVAVGFGDVKERPYSGFRLRAMFGAAREYEGSFGELFVSHRENALRASFIFTRAPDERAAELREITAYPGNVRVLRACYSIRALQRIQEVVNHELLRRRLALRLRSHVEYTSIEVKLNQIEVGLRRYSEDDERKIVRRYGPAVRVFPEDVNIGPDRR